jgi:UTP-glucose-1-phosphate uridylyltransferase
VIPAAGLGIWMLCDERYSKRIPVYDPPITEHVVKEAIGVGINALIVVIRIGKEAS